MNPLLDGVDPIVDSGSEFAPSAASMCCLSKALNLRHRGFLFQERRQALDVSLLHLHANRRSLLEAQPIVAEWRLLLVFREGWVIIVNCSHPATICRRVELIGLLIGEAVGLFTRALFQQGRQHVTADAGQWDNK